MIDQMNIAVELKHQDEHEPIDLFFEAINLILPSSKISEHSRKIHRSNSVPNDLAGLTSPESRTDRVKLDPDTPHGIDFSPIIESICTQVFTCLSRGCCQEFPSEADLAHHFDQQHKQCEISCKSVKSYRCEITKSGQMAECGRKTDSLNKMVSHILKEHTLQEQIAKKQNNTLEFKFISRHLSNLIICSIEKCCCLFVNRTVYRKHRQLIHERSAPSETSKHTVNKISSRLCADLILNNKHFKCDICGSKFTRPNHLKRHLRVHQDMKFKCEYCDQMFMKQSMLLSHVSVAHKNEKKKYKCPMSGCNKEFVCKMYFDTHMSRTHPNNDENSLYCVECKRHFAAKWLKNQHDQIKHKGSKLYMCLFENCGKTFPTSSKLQRHSQIHLKDKKYKCQFENCTAEFTRKEHLISHINVHSDGKPFQCDHPGCNGTFRYYNNLLTHKKCHLKTLLNNSPVEDQSKSANPDLDIAFTEADSFTPCLRQYVTPAYQESDELVGFVNEDILDNQEHVINMNSDDEEYTTCAVVLENLFGSARTDYKSNHAYIEKYRCKRKNLKESNCFVKRVKSLDCEEVDLMGNGQSPSFSGSSTNSSLDSIKSTLKQTLTSKQLRNRPLSSSLSFDIDYTSELKDSISLPDSSDVCFINCLDF